MASSTTEDATTGEDIASTKIPAPSVEDIPRNAFTAIMRRDRSPTKLKTAPPGTPTTDPANKTLFLGRDGLGAYIADPAAFPPSRVVYYNENFVVINDLFPKSILHLLLLPRHPEKALLHPYDAFEDVDFLSTVQEEVKKLRILAAKELKRRLSKYSEKERTREQALEEDAEEVPEGRDWVVEIESGIHAGPSMNHLHVHVMSRDMHSGCMRHRKHYNSFNTPFLVPVEDFPLADDDARRHPGREGYLDSDLKCWRCGTNFGNKFKRLKEHIDEEFEEWKRQ